MTIADLRAGKPRLDKLGGGLEMEVVILRKAASEYAIPLPRAETQGIRDHVAVHQYDPPARRRGRAPRP